VDPEVVQKMKGGWIFKKKNVNEYLVMYYTCIILREFLLPEYLAYNNIATIQTTIEY